MKNKTIFPCFPFMMIPLPKTIPVNRSVYPWRKIRGDIPVYMYVCTYKAYPNQVMWYIQSHTLHLIYRVQQK